MDKTKYFVVKKKSVAGSPYQSGGSKETAGV